MDCPNCNTRMQILYENRSMIEAETGCRSCNHRAPMFPKVAKKR